MLRFPVIGLESEFKVFIDEQEVVPEEYWRTPAAFVERPMLKRGTRSMQLPTGGALYFDGGVLEVVTPVIEIAPQCTSRAVRSLWEQLAFTRHELDRWERRNAKRARLQAFSCHYNISFELTRGERGRKRTIQKLALLLAHLVPVPAIVIGANRASTGLGVRPRRDRIEVTFDFTPDPGLMAAMAALLVGITREVMTWDSYRLEELLARGIPHLAGLDPGRHATRNGWLARAFHFPRDPFKTRVDARVWTTDDGRSVSLRELALEIATRFRDSIRRFSDPFSYRLLFSVLRGETRSLLDLDERPAVYDDVGRTVKWGETIPELDNYAAAMQDEEDDTPRRRRADVEEKLAPPWRGEMIDRRERVSMPPRMQRRSSTDRRNDKAALLSPRLNRSQYERVFLRLGTGKELRVGRELLTPVGVKGWYHAIFRNAKGDERILSIDQVLDALSAPHPPSAPSPHEWGEGRGEGRR